MTFIEGFVTPVPTANRDTYLAHARRGAEMVLGLGATRMVESWSDDVAHGQATDFYRAVQATEDESVLFSWFEYPDKATRDAANDKMMSDPRAAEMMQDMPFDVSRMIYAGFDALIDTGGGAPIGYVDAIVASVPPDRRDAFLDHARFTADLLRAQGATRVVDGWTTEAPDGEVTDYKRAVQAEAGEAIVFGWLEWPDKPTRDAGMAALMQDARMRDTPPPWNGRLAIFGGFAPILDTDAR